MENQSTELATAQIIILIASWYYYTRFYSKEPHHNSALSGSSYTDELMAGNSNRFFEVNRMDKRTFKKFVELLRRNGLTHSKLSREEKVMIFINIIKGKLEPEINVLY
jgi:hypothetical protein